MHYQYTNCNGADHKAIKGVIKDIKSSQNNQQWKLPDWLLDKKEFHMIVDTQLTELENNISLYPFFDNKTKNWRDSNPGVLFNKTIDIIMSKAQELQRFLKQSTKFEMQDIQNKLDKIDFIFSMNTIPKDVSVIKDKLNIKLQQLKENFDRQAYTKSIFYKMK